MEKPSDSPPLADFAAWSTELRRAIDAAEAREARGKTLAPAETSYGVLRVQCYRYLRKLSKQGLIGDLRAYVEARDPGRWHRHPGGDADWVMRLLEVSRKKQWLTPPRRARVVLELSFASQCNVRSRWLLPFLYECGNQSLIEALAVSTELPTWLRKYQQLAP